MFRVESFRLGDPLQISRDREAWDATVERATQTDNLDTTMVQQGWALGAFVVANYEHTSFQQVTRLASSLALEKPPLPDALGALYVQGAADAYKAIKGEG